MRTLSEWVGSPDWCGFTYRNSQPQQSVASASRRIEIMAESGNCSSGSRNRLHPMPRWSVSSIWWSASRPALRASPSPPLSGSM